MTTCIYIINDTWVSVHSHVCVCVCEHMDLKTHRSVSWLLTWTHLYRYMQIYLLITHRLYPPIHTDLFLVMYSYVWSYTGLYLSIHRAEIYHTQVCSWTYMNLGRLEMNNCSVSSDMEWSHSLLFSWCPGFWEGPRWFCLYEWCLGRDGWKPRPLWSLLHVDTGLCRQCLSNEVVRLVQCQLRASRGRRQKLSGQLSLIPSSHQYKIQVFNLRYLIQTTLHINGNDELQR